MCRHCERLVEDRDSAPIVHEFMRVTAEKMTRNLGRPIAANDLEIKVEVKVTDDQPNHLADSDPALRIRRMLAEMSEPGNGVL